MWISSPGNSILNFSTVENVDWTILREGGRPVHCRVYSSISGLHPLNASSTHPRPKFWQPKMSPDMGQGPPRGPPGGNPWGGNTSFFLTAASNSVLWVHHDLFNYFPTQQHSKSILNASEELKPQYIVILLYPSYKIGMIVFPVCWQQTGTRVHQAALWALGCLFPWRGHWQDSTVRQGERVTFGGGAGMEG